MHNTYPYSLHRSINIVTKLFYNLERFIIGFSLLPSTTLRQMKTWFRSVIPENHLSNECSLRMGEFKLLVIVSFLL